MIQHAVQCRAARPRRPRGPGASALAQCRTDARTVIVASRCAGGMRVATETDRPRGPPGKYPSSYIIIAYYDRSRVGTEPRPVARRGYLDRVRVRGKTVLYDTISYNYYDVEFYGRENGRFKLKTTLS